MEQLHLPIKTGRCRFYTECIAPLCPVDGSSTKSIWFPAEPICRLRKAPEWVTKQRRIARLGSIDRNRGFTIVMLRSISHIRRGLQGADPDLLFARKDRTRLQRKRMASKSRAVQARLNI